MRKIAIFDVDGVLIQGQSQQMLVLYLYEKGIINIFFLLKIVFWFLLYKLNLVRNNVEVMEQSYKVFKGLDVERMATVFKSFFEKDIKPKINKEVIELINSHKINNYEIILVSTSIHEIVNQLAEYLNIKFVIATTLESCNSFYTGQISGDIAYGQIKVKEVVKMIKKNNFSLSESYGYGDHISDAHLLEIVFYPIAVNPDSLLKKVALERNWTIYDF